MVESKFKGFGIFAVIMVVVYIVFISFCIYILVSVIFLDGHLIPRGTISPIGALLFIFIFLIMLIALIIGAIKFFFLINIDTNNKTILFKNIFTQKKNPYLFTELDGYLETYATTFKGGDFKVFYIVKNKKAVKIIKGYYYSNMEEMQRALVSLNYLGFEKDFKTLARKSFFSQSIIK